MARIPSLNDDVLSFIVPMLSLRDAIHLSQTSRMLGGVARRRVLSSLQVSAPLQIADFYHFLLEELGGYRMQCLRKLTINRSYNTSANANVNLLLPRIIERASNLRTLTIFRTEDQLKDAPALGEAIARLRNLEKLDLCDISEDGLQLCAKLPCKPSVVRLTSGAPGFKVDPATFCSLPIFQNASIVTLQGFEFTGPEVDVPAKWTSTHTLRLRNMDSAPLLTVCPRLVCLQLAFHSYPTHHNYPRHAPVLTTHAHVLDVMSEKGLEIIPQSIISALRGVHPTVLSIPCNISYTRDEYWKDIGNLLREPYSRVRYLDILLRSLNDNSTLALLVRLPSPLFCRILLSTSTLQRLIVPLLRESCQIPYIRLCLTALDGKPLSVDEWEHATCYGTFASDSFADWHTNFRATIPTKLARDILSLEYVGIAYGYMVFDQEEPNVPRFGGRTVWWRIHRHGGPKGKVEVVEVKPQVGIKLDAHLRSEAFAKTLVLGNEWM